MAELYKDRHGNLGIDFTYPGLDRFRISLGMRYTKENLAWAKKAHLNALEREISAEDLPAIVKRFPKCQRLKCLAVTEAGHQVGLTVNELLDMVQQDYDENQRSNAPRFKSTIKHVRKYFQGKLAAELTGADLHAYKSRRLKEQASRGTINRELSAIRRGFNLAREQDILKEMPKFVLFEENNARKGMFSEAEMAALMRRLPDYLLELVQVAYLTGWRRGELLSRQWRHVKDGYLRLETGETKNGQGRAFPLGYPGLGEVFAQLEKRRERELAEGRIIPWLFHRDGEQIKGFRKVWDRVMDEMLAAGEIHQRMLFHDFRRTAVSNFDTLRIAQKATMQLTGHLTDAVYRRYSIVGKAQLDWVVQTANEAVAAGRAPWLDFSQKGVKASD